VLEAGSEYETIEDGAKMGKVFLEAQVNPHTKKRTGAIGIHNVVDLSTFLSVLGRQEIRMSLRYGGKSFANYVMKVEKDRVLYLDINDGPESEDTTIGIALDIEDVSTLKTERSKFLLKMARRLLPGLNRYALWFVAEQLQIKEKQSHRALSDVEITLGVFNKLKDILRLKGISDFGHFLSLFAVDAQFLQGLNAQKLSRIQEAIDLGVGLKIKYMASGQAQVSEREVLPKELRQENNRSYLVAFCRLRNEERTFRVDGILHLEIV